MKKTQSWTFLQKLSKYISIFNLRHFYDLSLPACVFCYLYLPIAQFLQNGKIARF